MSGSIWAPNSRCGCGSGNCCRIDGICCKRNRCVRKCCKKERLRLTDVNAVFFTTDYVGAWQGMRFLGGKNTGSIEGNFIIVGTSGSSGIVYLGPLNALSTSVFPVNVPNATATSVYGPDVPNVNQAPIRLVGTFRNNTSENVQGFLFSGTVEELNNSSNYRTINIGNTFTFVHSLMGNLAVGTNDNQSQYNTFNLPLGPINAFVYNLSNGNTDKVHFPGSVSNSAYGIWHNSGTSYTICGGYSFSAIEITSVYINRNGVALPLPYGHAFLVDYDSRTRRFCNWTTFNYPESNIVTHFQGISQVAGKRNMYQIAADSALITATNVTQGSWVEIHRKKDDCGRTSFKACKWININYPNSGLSQACSVAGAALVGIAELNDAASDIIPYQVQLLVKGY